VHENAYPRLNANVQSRGLNPFFYVVWVALVVLVAVVANSPWIPLVFGLSLTAVFWVIDSQVRAGRWFNRH
jgi:threonine/homoserine/homoserine lactone efflux protein